MTQKSEYARLSSPTFYFLFFSLSAFFILVATPRLLDERVSCHPTYDTIKIGQT